MNKKVSVIVPVYNGEKTIEKCINSLINNEYKNIEIIVINDGSIDKTLEIVENIEDERIKVISQENAGVSEARNLGIMKSTGDYIFFIDADDYIEKYIIKIAMEQIEDNDILMFGYQTVEKGKILEKYTLDNQEWNKNEICKKVYDNISNGVYMHSLWNKIYKKTLIQDIKLDSSYIVSEDMDFNIKCFRKANKIKTIDCIGYNYNIIQNQTKYREGIVDSHIKITEELLKYFKEIPNSKVIISRFLYNSIFYDILAITNYKKLKLREKFKIYNYIKQQEIFKKLDIKKGITKKKQILYRIFFKNNFLAYYIIKLYCKLERN